jgi:hypothetical protein
MSFAWSDEVIWNRNGRFKQHNCVYWATDNPNRTEERAHNSPRISVCSGKSYIQSMPLSSTPSQHFSDAGGGHFEYVTLG